MSQGFILSSVDRLARWARTRSLWYVEVGGGCCASEVFSAESSRYDIERFGCLLQESPRHADVLIVTTAVNDVLGEEVKKIYDAMPEPKYVMSVGTCSNCGGPFKKKAGYAIRGGVDRFIPVDVYIPGCPPRPEAIMNGIIKLQEKINGSSKSQ